MNATTAFTSDFRPMKNDGGQRGSLVIVVVFDDTTEALPDDVCNNLNGGRGENGLIVFPPGAGE